MHQRRISRAATPLGRLAGVISIVCLSLVLAGCHQSVDLSQKTLDAMNAAIDKIAAQSQAWQTELPALENKLYSDGSSLAAQIGQILNNTALASTEDAACWTTYAQQVVLEELENLRVVNWFVNQKPTYKPFPCAIQPPGISIAGVRSGIYTDANMIGFNFTPSQIDPRLPNPVVGGEFMDLSGNRISVPPGPPLFNGGPFVVSLNLAAFNLEHPLPDNTVSLAFLFNDAPAISTDITPVAGPSVTVVAPLDQQTIYGNRVSLQAHATDSRSYPLTYSATGLPAAVTIDPSSGTIAGFPATLGTRKVTITATDSQGVSGSASFYWLVIPSVIPFSGVGGGGEGGGGHCNIVVAGVLVNPTMRRLPQPGGHCV